MEQPMASWFTAIPQTLYATAYAATVSSPEIFSGSMLMMPSFNTITLHLKLATTNENVYNRE
jgi:hypothetical protein